MSKTKLFSYRKHLLAVLLCVVFLTAGLTLGCQGVSQAEAQLRPDLKIIIDGTEQTFYNAGGQEIHPVLYEGTTYLPVRAIGELMGKNVNWDQAAMTISIGGPRTGTATAGTPDAGAQVQAISAQLRDDFIIQVDGTVRTFKDANGKAVYPLLYEGSTYLPLRAIGGLMGKEVSWDGDTKTVTLSGSLVTDADSFSPVAPGISQGANTGDASGTASVGKITPEAAVSKALAHAGLTEKQVTVSQNKLEWENGRQVYDIEFYTADYKEYDYEIDAVTGEVVSFDYDAESIVPPSQTAAGQISSEKAQEIALAKVPGATSANVVKLELDWDDGKAVYEVEIRYNRMEYECEIDAVTGAILSWEADQD